MKTLENKALMTIYRKDLTLPVQIPPVITCYVEFIIYIVKLFKELDVMH